jgi:hypothetical protein
MIRRVIAIVPLLVCLSCPPLAADDAALRQPIDGFYWVHQQSSQEGIPDATQRARYAPYISPDLAMLLIEADTAATRFTKANKDSPPLVEGDLFSPNFEGISAFNLDMCTADGNTARCKVKLHFADKNPRAQDKSVDWVDTVTVVRTPAGWRVDDIAYGGNWDFGNHGTLKAILQDVIAELGG